jgi:membrane-bound ClpP family serine protease
MEDKGKTTGNRNRHAIILGVIGVILLILGIAIVTIHGAPLRGSGVGTIAIIAGVVLLVIAGLRAFYKPAAKKSSHTDSSICCLYGIQKVSHSYTYGLTDIGMFVPL